MANLTEQTYFIVAVVTYGSMMGTWYKTKLERKAKTRLQKTLQARLGGGLQYERKSIDVFKAGE